ncbi:hypothetical protein QQX98_013014 [Neonectria punicea]|uniref:MADS-box domain-containing protein n=1 Tax=Neonectria punicea TaxID=979145 RepID=A0ABR1GHI2_9HYPO
MAPRARSPAQKRKRAFNTRSQGMIRKVKEMHQFTDAKTAVVGIVNGKMFWYDEAGVLPQLGIAHEPQDGLRAQSSSSASSFSSAESVSSFTTDPDSPGLSTREGSAEPSEPDRHTSTPSADAVSLPAEGESLSTTDAWVSPAGDKTPEHTGIAFLDLDFFGLEKDSEYGM